MLLSEKNIQKIGIFRALQLGDLLCAMPAIRALKKAFPNADIFLIGLPNAASFVSRFHRYFAGLIPFSGYPGLPEQPYEVVDVLRFMRQMQEENFDLVLQMQGNGTLVNPMVELWGGRACGGYYTEGDYCPPSPYFLPYPTGIHEIRRHLKLMAHLGIPKPLLEEALEFPITEEDRRSYQELSLGLTPETYVCVHPGSRGSWRQWPPEYFAALANQVAAAGKKVVLTGTEDELEIIAGVQKRLRTPASVTAGKTKLGAMAVLLEQSSALVSNCTGVSHIAAALKKPSFVISMDGEPERWAPIDTTLHTTWDWTKHPDFDAVEQRFQQFFQRNVR